MEKVISNGSGSTIMTREFMDLRIDALKELSDVRFKASEVAVNAALATQVKAVDAAFLASEKALTAALSASEKAISKSESSQGEVNKIIAELQKDVISLRESRSQGSGKESARGAGKEQSNFNLSLVLSIGFNILMLLAMVWKMLPK